MRSLRVIFMVIVVVLPLLVLPAYYLSLQIGHGLWGTIPVIMVTLFTFAFPILRGKSLVKISFYSMGIFSFLLVTFLVRDGVGFTTRFFLSPDLTVVLALALTTIGFLWGRRPYLRKVMITIPELPEKLKGLTLIQISDLHVGKNIGQSYVEHVVKKIQEQSPDMVVFTGDIGDSEPSLYAHALDPFLELTPPFGMHYVPGNHEYYWNMPEWLQVMRDRKIIPLLNEGRIISIKDESVLMAGVTDPMDRKNPPNLLKPLQGHEKSVLKILLSHRPDPAKKASELGYHLQLSGHTHGGQFFPWTLAVRLVHQYHLGLFQVGNLAVYVSGGTGSWGPMLRLGTTAEITHITLL